MKFVQIYNGKAHYIFESEEKPVFHPSIVLVDITGRDDIQEGWDYNSETGEFTEPLEQSYEPVQPEETLEQKVTRLEEKIDQFNLINTDISLTVYEEVLALREEVAKLKGV